MSSKVEKYIVRVWGGKNGHSSEARAKITCYDNSRAIGFINFHDEGQTVPADRNANNQVWMNLPASQLGTVVDLLRNESPLYLQFAFGSGVLTTGQEYVGEGE